MHNRLATLTGVALLAGLAALLPAATIPNRGSTAGTPPPSKPASAMASPSRTSAVTPQPLDTESIHKTIHADRLAFKGYFDETRKLMDALWDQKNELSYATFLMDTINRLQERMASEGSLLDVYDHVTNVAAEQDAEQLIREHYEYLAKVTDVDAKNAASVARYSKSKELTALAENVETDIQTIARRYWALAKE